MKKLEFKYFGLASWHVNISFLCCLCYRLVIIWSSCRLSIKTSKSKVTYQWCSTPVFSGVHCSLFSVLCYIPCFCLKCSPSDTLVVSSYISFLLFLMLSLVKSSLPPPLTVKPHALLIFFQQLCYLVFLVFIIAFSWWL